MRLLLSFLIPLLVGTVGIGEEREGTLISGCASMQKFASMPAAEANRYCRWVVHYQAGGGPEVKEIEASLGEHVPMQPPRIEGDQASVLAKKRSGEIEVVHLEKREEAWRQILAIAGTGKKTRTVTR